MVVALSWCPFEKNLMLFTSVCQWQTNRFLKTILCFCEIRRASIMAQLSVLMCQVTN